MKNLSQGRDVENSLKKTTFELGEADYLATATEERIMLLNSDIAGLNANLHQAEHELDKAESRLRRKTRTRDLVRLGVGLAGHSVCRRAHYGLVRREPSSSPSYLEHQKLALSM